jgi:hypothetical protein
MENFKLHDFNSHDDGDLNRMNNSNKNNEKIIRTITG